MFKKFWTWLKSLFGGKSAPVVVAPVVTTPVAPTPVVPVPVVPSTPVATNDNDANGCYTDARVTNPLFKGFGIALVSEKAKFDPSSHQYKFIDFNVKQIDGQIQLQAEEGGNFLVQNTCRQVNAIGQDAGASVPNTIRCPSTITTRDAAVPYINALSYVDPTAGKGGVPGA